MNILKKTEKNRGLGLMLVSLLLMLLFPGVLFGAEVPSAEDVAFGKAPLPTIAELTGGKVNEGDVIDKNNMDLVKDFLTKGQIGQLELGMTMRAANHKLKPLEGTPTAYNELTQRNRGKAIVDEETITVWYEKEGQNWPGGLPFPEPETAAQVMANVKFGVPMDDFSMKGWFDFVSAEGKMYKKQGYWGFFVYCNSRSSEPHVLPGYEDQMYRKVTCFTSPTEAKGLGGFNIRFYDDTAQYDQGFYYHPAFKKTGRSNATTWMNNNGGSDFTTGDGLGMQDPMSDWNFKYVGTQYKLHSEFIAPYSLIDKKQRPNEKLQFDVGKKFPQFGYVVLPFHVIEAKPKIKHVYGMRTLYILTHYYSKPTHMIPMVDIYDTQLKLWKFYTCFPGIYREAEHYAVEQGVGIWDLQTRHSSVFWYYLTINNGLHPKSASLKSLLAKGR